MAKLKMFLKPTCTTCRKVKGLLLEMGAQLEEHDLGRDRLTAEQLDALLRPALETEGPTLKRGLADALGLSRHVTLTFGAGFPVPGASKIVADLNPLVTTMDRPSLGRRRRP